MTATMQVSDLLDRKHFIDRFVPGDDPDGFLMVARWYPGDGVSMADLVVEADGRRRVYLGAQSMAQGLEDQAWLLVRLPPLSRA